jgi:hypothetical protein
MKKLNTNFSMLVCSFYMISHLSSFYLIFMLQIYLAIGYMKLITNFEFLSWWEYLP